MVIHFKNSFAQAIASFTLYRVNINGTLLLSYILFMDYPTNNNFPEPMRVWPENMNGRGDVFFSFNPTRNLDWLLVPYKRYVLKYRMLVYDGTISPGLAGNAWNSFSHPPQVTITKLK